MSRDRIAFGQSILDFLERWIGQVVTAVGSVQWEGIIIHPLVFAVFPILSLYIENFGKGFLREALGASVGALVFTAVLWLVVSVLVRDSTRSAVIASAFAILFFSYGHAIMAFSSLLDQLHLLDAARFLVEGKRALTCWLVVWGAVLVVVTVLVVNVKSDLRSVTSFLNVVGVGLVVISGGRLVATAGRLRLPDRLDSVAAEADVASELDKAGLDAEFTHFVPLVAKNGSGYSAREAAAAEEFTALWTEELAAGDKLSGVAPDVYYIVLDMYARGDVLKDVYHYGNSEFLSFLSENGFYVADQSRANYHHTLQSLASSLNLTYLDDVAELVGEGCTNIKPLTLMIKHSKVMQYVRNHGYKVIAFSTGHEFTDNKDVDLYLKPDWWHPSQFQKGLMDVTPFLIFRKTRDDFHRSRILYIFDHLADATQYDAPTFVFAHILAPHPPYAFGPHGEPALTKKTHFSYEREEFIATYRDQVSHVNMRMKAAIEEILSRSPEPPIIIIQSDHGAAYHNTFIEARIPILNAYYFPDQSYDALYEDISPVNTFRVVFNQYFGTDYPILEDRSFFVENEYRYTDVTDQLVSDD